jgi:hypothetical protein
MRWGADGIDPVEILLVGGSWRGLLFENRSTNFPLSMSWGFTFEFAEITRSFGTSPLSLTVDWVSLGGAAWQAMSGHRASGSFGDPMEASIYFFDHHRFDTAAVEVTAQDMGRLYVRATVSDDVDGLGLDSCLLRGGLRSTECEFSRKPSRTRSTPHATYLRNSRMRAACSERTVGTTTTSDRPSNR